MATTNRRRDTRKLFVWLNRVLADAELTPNAFKVAFKIGQHFNSRHGGAAWPSSLTVATSLGIDEATVIRAVRQLRERGHLTVEPGHAGRGHSNRYRMSKPKIKGAPAHLKPAGKPAQAQVLRATRKPAPVSLKPAPVQENYLEPSTGPPSAVPVEERETLAALAVPPGAPPTGAGAPEGKRVAVDRFSDLLAIWKRPHGDEDAAAAWTAFVAICEGPSIADEIIASAHRWVTAYQHKPEMLKPLEKWLARGTWKNQPPSRTPQRNGGKVSASDLALEFSQQFRRAGH